VSCKEEKTNAPNLGKNILVQMLVAESMATQDKLQRHGGEASPLHTVKGRIEPREI